VAEEKLSVKLEIKNQKLKSQFETALQKVRGFNIQGPTSEGYSELLIFELGDNVEKEFLFIQDMLNSGQVGEVFFASDSSDQNVLRQAIRIGAREFFNIPVEDEEIKHALEGFKGRKKKEIHSETPRDGKIINIIGSKGGVGTTTVAVNLAVSLAEKKVCNPWH
jgi:pilus assembly protein CpaE